MKTFRTSAITTALAFAAAICGVFVGRALLAPEPPVVNRLHVVLYDELDLNASQLSQLKDMERTFMRRRDQLEAALGHDNAMLARAIEAEHGYGPAVAAAIERSHRSMGALQKVTMEHVFEMRGVLTPGQAALYDQAVTDALTNAGP